MAAAGGRRVKNVGAGPVALSAVAPDLVFFPMAMVGRGGAWPGWGEALYNAAPTHAVALPVFAGVSVLQGKAAWPLLAWVAHVEADRAVGFDLMG